MLSTEEAFRRLTIADPGILHGGQDRRGVALDVTRLDERTEALVQLAALIAIDGPMTSYQSVVEAALRAGARREDLPAVLLAVAGITGSARVVGAAPRIAMAAGYDVEAALE